jgi:AraC-like DNA-binding protein
MVRIFDAADIPSAYRLDAYRAGVSTTEIPWRIGSMDHDKPFTGVLERWELEPGIQLFRSVDSGTSYQRGDRELKVAAPELMSVNLKLGSIGEMDIGQQQMLLRPGDLFLTDLTSSISYSSHGSGTAQTFIVDYATLGLPVDMVRSAQARLQASPVYSIVRSHMSSLSAAVDDLPVESASRSMLTTATMQLVIALITTAAGDGAPAREALQNSEMTRVAAFVRQNLRDSELSAGGIAHANHMSVRRLYQLWESQEKSLAEHIISERLEGARQDLAHSDPSSASIAQVAASWGFIDPSHFARRFKAAYQVSPTQWRRASDERSFSDSDVSSQTAR